MRLSICIPTHQGRFKTLSEAVESVLCQLTPELSGEVEICVSDNASEDGTAELMRGYIEKYGELFVYSRSEVNKGFDYNLLNSVNIAHGDYCWILGSDDQIVGGGIQEVMRLLSLYPDVAGVTVNRANYDSQLRGRIPPDEWYMLPDDPERLHLYTSADETFLNCSVFHTYMSAQILDRRLWLEVVRERGVEKFKEHAYYPHLYGVGAMVLKRPKWLWCPDRLVKYRTDNDASLEFLKNKWHRHILVTMSGLSRVWVEIIGKGSPVYKTVMYKYALFSWRPEGVFWLKEKSNYTFRDELPLIVGFTKHLYFIPSFWLKTFPLLLIPHILLPQKRRVLNSLMYRSRLAWHNGLKLLKGSR